MDKTVKQRGCGCNRPAMQCGTQSRKDNALCHPGESVVVSGRRWGAGLRQKTKHTRSPAQRVRLPVELAMQPGTTLDPALQAAI